MLKRNRTLMKTPGFVESVLEFWKNRSGFECAGESDGL